MRRTHLFIIALLGLTLFLYGFRFFYSPQPTPNVTNNSNDPGPTSIPILTAIPTLTPTPTPRFISSSQAFSLSADPNLWQLTVNSTILPETWDITWKNTSASISAQFKFTLNLASQSGTPLPLTCPSHQTLCRLSAINGVNYKLTGTVNSATSAQLSYQAYNEPYLLTIRGQLSAPETAFASLTDQWDQVTQTFRWSVIKVGD